MRGTEQLVPDPALSGDALRDYCAGGVSPYLPVLAAAERIAAVL